MSHTYDPINASPQIEMASPISTSTLRPSPPTQTSSNNISLSNSTSTLLPHEQDTSHFETHFNKTEQASTTFPYKAKTRRQFWHILLKSLAQWLITLLLCIAYLLALLFWNRKGTVSQRSKRICNAITTGISIALGLNIASSLKGMALNARWAFLHASKRNLYELDLTLHADSLMDVGKLAFVSKRPMVFGVAISWLIFNIFAQAALAAISLTYGFDTSTEKYLFAPGYVKIPVIKNFSNTADPRIEDEQTKARDYGGLAWDLGISSSIEELPAKDTIYQDPYYNIWRDDPNNKIVFVLTESSSPASTQNTDSLRVYTNRILEMHYSCSSYKPTSLGNDSFNTSNPDITCHIPPYAYNATNFYTDSKNICPDNSRCAIVQALEVSNETSTSWYYTCNITLSATLNDEKNISYISNNTSRIAASAIANTGYKETITYPRNTTWGRAMNGNESEMGIQIAAFGLTSLSIAATVAPKATYPGREPHAGFALDPKHAGTFLLIISLIPLVQFIMCFVVAVWSNSVQVGDNAYIGMSLLLKPIADELFAVSGGVDNRALKEAKKRIMVRYERGVDGKWGFAMS
ncbi:hypothetical protein EAE96_002587 [Botrytis aclada]|nr:hypothetical protein EAE96_002587 [Botrytis aclada]